MAASARTATNTATPVRIVPATVTPVGAPAAVTVLRNTDATNSVFIGDSAVTTATGYDLLPLAVLVLPVEATNTPALYGIAGAGTPVVAVLRT